MATPSVDLDRFKPINDTYGHKAGDAVLKAIAGRLLGLVRENDMVARIGGDEFAVVIADMSTAAAARQFGERLSATFQDPIEFDGRLLSVGASIGLALSNGHKGWLRRRHVGSGSGDVFDQGFARNSV